MTTLGRLARWAQRRAHAIPAPARRVVRRIMPGLAGAGSVAGPGEDWTVPLIPGRGHGDVQDLPRQFVATSDEVEPAGVEPAIRCVVAIGVLDVGGMDEMAAFLGRRLPEFGVETTVIFESTHEVGQTGDDGRLVRALAAANVPLRQVTPDDVAAFFAAYRPAVVSAHGAPGWMLDAAHAAGVPWVETLHGMHHFLHPQSWVPERTRASRVSALIAVSDMVRRQYLTGVPSFPADRLVTIPNGVDELRIAQVDRGLARAALGLRDEFLFVSLARYGLQKNTYALVTAFAEVAARHPDAHLLVAGRADDPAYFAQVADHAHRQECADRIHLRGHCTNPSALLAAADAFVLDSFFEGWSLASMEALVLGVPVVLADVGGAREQLSVPGRGYLVANPAHHPESVDWATIADLRFRAQDNRAQLVDAMSRVVREADLWAARRDELASEARSAFPARLCLRRHAEVLRAVALGRPVPQFLPVATLDS